MASNNFCFFEGRLTYEPEVKVTSNGIKVVNFQIAAQRPYQKDKESKADFIDCQAWRGNAEFIEKCFHKGDPIKVQAAVKTDTYTDKDGNQRKSIVFVVQDISFVVGSTKKDNSTQDNQMAQPAPSYAATPQNQQTTPPQNVAAADDFEEIVDDDDDLPF